MYCLAGLVQCWASKQLSVDTVQEKSQQLLCTYIWQQLWQGVCELLMLRASNSTDLTSLRLISWLVYAISLNQDGMVLKN